MRSANTFQGFIAVNLAIDRPIAIKFGHACDVFRDRFQASRGDQQAGATILDDIFDFRRSQAGRDADKVQPGALGGPANLEIAWAVLRKDGQRITMVQPQRSKRMCDLVRALVQLAKGHSLAAAGHDVSRFVRLGLRMMRRMHG